MNNKEIRPFGRKFKLIYSVVQMTLFYLAISLFPVYDLVCIFALVISYLIPLYINSYFIKFKNEEIRVSSLIFEDVIYYYLPSLGLSLIIEFALYFAGVIGDIVGFYTVVFFIVSTLLNLFQWFRYFIQNKFANKFKK